MEKLYYVTGNSGKVKSAMKYLNGMELEMVNYDFIEPDVNDITYTAKWKVEKAYEMIGKPCIALDSGFYIPDYPEEKNFPGAFVHRKIIDGIGLDGLLENMKEVKNRYCYFLECLAYYDGKELKVFYGKAEGALSYKKSGIDDEKKWSPLWEVFIPLGCSKTLSELTEGERSNRPNTTHAFVEFRNWYQKQEKELVKTKW